MPNGRFIDGLFEMAPAIGITEERAKTASKLIVDGSGPSVAGFPAPCGSFPSLSAGVAKRNGRMAWVVVNLESRRNRMLRDRMIS